MRNYTLNIRLAAVMVAPLLLACGSDNTGGGTTYAAFPDCKGEANQALATDSTGQLVCRTLPAGTASVPDCSGPDVALTYGPSGFSCVPRNVVDASTKTLEVLFKGGMPRSAHGCRVEATGRITGAVYFHTR